MPSSRTPCLFISLSVTAAAMPGVVFAQDDRQPPPQTIIAFESVSLADCMTHPKDAALARAISMIPARLREMPREIPDLGDAPMEVFDLIDIAFEGPYRFAIVSEGADPATGAPRISGELAFGSRDARGANAAYSSFSVLVADAPQFERSDDGSLSIQSPIGPVAISAYQGADGQWWFGARIGDPNVVDGAIAALPASDHGQTLMRGSMDLKSIVAPLRMMGAMMAAGNPEAQAGMAMLNNSGILDAMSLTMDTVVWRNDDGIHSRVVMHDARETMLKMGMTEESLTKSQLAAIPADAMTAMISRSNPEKILGVIEMLRSLGPEAQQFFDSFTEATGIDLENDIFRSLNGVCAVYASDSTGGSGLMSWVALMGVSDHDAMRDALGKLADKANGLAMEIPYGASNGKYLRLAHTSHAGVDFLTFQTPGIPQPFSPTISLTGDWLVIGASRQSAFAAAMQAAGRGDTGLFANESFGQQWTGSLDGVTKIQFLDTPRAIRKGYGLTTLLGGFIENGVRSPLGADREPGMVVPPYNDLVRDSRAIVKVTRWEGDDLVMTMHSDGSSLVNLAGVAGVYAEPLMLALPAAAMVAGASEAIQEGALDPPF